MGGWVRGGGRILVFEVTGHLEPGLNRVKIVVVRFRTPFEFLCLTARAKPPHILHTPLKLGNPSIVFLNDLYNGCTIRIKQVREFQ